MRWLELEEALGKAIPDDAHSRPLACLERRVVGVIEDFHFHGPRYKIEPLVMGHNSMKGWVSLSCGCAPAISKKPSK